MARILPGLEREATMGPQIISIMMIVALGFFAYFAWQRVDALLTAKPENRFDDPISRLKGLWTFGILQERLLKHHKAAGWMHALIFWGFCVLLLRSAVMVMTGYFEHFHVPGPVGDAYTLIKDLFEVIVLVMVSYAAWRRAVKRPARLTNSVEAYVILGLIGLLMASDFVFDASKFALYWNDATVQHERTFALVGKVLSLAFAPVPTSVLASLYKASYWLHMVVLMGFAVYLTKSKHMHVITSLPNVFFKSPGQPALAISRLDLGDETAEGFGVAKIADLTWKQTLDLYSCTECGRCLSSCPTHVTDKPLSLKGLNDDLKHHLFDQIDAHAGSASQGNAPSLVDSIIKPETVWACTTCGFCETACPVFIEQVPRIVGMRQHLTLMEADYPEELKKLYTGLERTANPWSIPPDQRIEWTQGLDILTMAEARAQQKPVELLYFVGCMASFDARNQKVAKALVQILQAAGVSFAILGREEKCNGDSARRLGNEYLFQELAQYTVDKFNSYDVKTVLTACPHCHNTLKNEYPQFGGNYRVLHHTEYIRELLEQNRIEVDATQKDVLYHDSCYLGRYNDIYEQPREILAKVSQNAVKEFKRNREESFCCGAGGGRMWMEETIGSQINQNRVAEGLEEEPKVIASGCPFCLTMMRDGVTAHGRSESVETVDVAELVAASLKRAN